MDPHSLAEPLQPSLQRQDNRAISAAARVLTRGSRRNRSETATLSPPPSLQLPPPPALALAAVAPSQVSLQPPGAAASGSAAVTAAAEAAVTAARIRRCLLARAWQPPKPGGIRLTRTLREEYAAPWTRRLTRTCTCAACRAPAHITFDIASQDFYQGVSCSYSSLRGGSPYRLRACGSLYRLRACGVS